MKVEKWSIDDIPDLNGKVIIVTGGNSGIGFESSKAFAARGAKVIIACRSMVKAGKARAKIIAQYPDADIWIRELDLADLSSIRNFVYLFKKDHSALDILINNAGILAVQYQLTRDGFECQMGTNHLGHYALTGLLIDTIISTQGSRVVNISSIAHKKADMDFNNLLFAEGRHYTKMGAYRRSKLANLYFTFELQRFFESKNTSSIALVAHPGVTESNIARHMLGNFFFSLLKPLIQLVLQKASIGALSQIRAAVDPDVKGGQFYGPDGKSEWRGYPVLVEPTEYAKNKENAMKLWEISEELTGVNFG